MISAYEFIFNKLAFDVKKTKAYDVMMRERKKSWGGKRAGAGRSRVAKSPLTQYTVRLTPEQAAFARQIGGDLSAGVRLALDQLKREPNA